MRHSLGVLNANLYIMEVRMSPLLVTRALYDVKGAELGHGQFIDGKHAECRQS